MASITVGGPASMDPEKLKELFEEPPPQSSIRTARAARALRDIAPGTVLGDKYEVERRLGEGAMGIVFAARHLGLDEMVAIKFVRPDVPDVDGALARFAREAKLAARIHSEHVAKVFDAGVLEPLGPFIVMEYLQGSSLAELLEAEGPLPVERLVGYLLQACEGLAAAHAIGVVHRDVKPENLFVTRRAGAEVVRLLDFGIAQVLPIEPAPDGAAASAPAIVLGSPLYMAPEQLRPGSPIDARVDIWALGVVAYELLTGNMPFGGASLPEICSSILDAEPSPLGAAYPAALAAIVRRCLMKDPARRFDSVADLAAALLPLAPRDACSYASRASSILRASSALPAALLEAPALEREAAAPGAARVSAAAGLERPRTARFDSAALVASATVLALAALGVVAALSRGGGPEGGPARTVVVAPARQPASLGIERRAAATPTPRPPDALSNESMAALASPPEGEPSALPSGVPLADATPPVTEPSVPRAARTATRASRPAGARETRKPRARRSAAVEKTARATERRRAVTRVRLVEPLARPQLVERGTSASGSRPR